jgi:site-specific DNA-methyltransferase (adenine-specific)
MEFKIAQIPSGTTIDRSVYSSVRTAINKNTKVNSIFNNKEINANDKNKMNGIDLLKSIFTDTITACFFDPQYRGIMDKMSYGNEGSRQIERALLSQMTDTTIIDFIKQIDRVLIPSGHLFLWIDKFHLCQGTSHWTNDTSLQIVDLITWDKGKIGMGYRTRRKSEYMLILQKKPIRAKGVWVKHTLPDVWTEKIVGKIHPHQKPIELQKQIIDAISSKNDYIIDPCAGSYSVLEACKQMNRNFIGCDLKNI